MALLMLKVADPCLNLYTFVLFLFCFYFQEGVLIFASQHFITLIRKSYFAE